MKNNKKSNKKNKPKAQKSTKKVAKKAPKVKVKKVKKEKKIVVPKIRAKKKNKSSLAMRASKTVSTKNEPKMKIADRQSQGMDRLLHKGKERGYITYDEIL